MTIKYRSQINGDYSFGNNAQSFLSGEMAVAQAVKTRLLLLEGEWWEDQSNGLPLFQSILGQPGTPEKLKSIDLILQERIATTPGVISIKDFTGTYENRQYTVNCTVETEFGDAVIDITF